MNFNNILKPLAAGALLLVGWACTDEVKYTPATIPAGDQVYFSNDITSVQIPENATSLPVELERVVSEGTVSVSVTGSVVDAEGNAVVDIFTFPEEVTFADGETTATYNVGVDYSKVVAETNYFISLSITGEDASPYGLTELSFVASHSPWTDWKPYSESDPYFETVLTCYPFEAEEVVDTVFVSKSLTNPNLEKYRFPAYLYTNFYLDFDITVDKSSVYTIDGKKVYQAILPETNTHFETKSGILAYLDLYNYYLGLGATPAQAQQKVVSDGTPSYFDEEKGAFFIALCAIDMGDYEGGTWGDPAYIMFQLPGFASYSFVYNVLGNYVDSTGSENAIVQIVRSEDINSYAYEVEKGTLTAAQIAELQDALAVNPDAELIYDVTYNAVVPFSEDGNYTIITVAFDADGNRVYADSFTFEATSVKKESDWVKKGICEYTDGFMGLYSFTDGSGKPVDLSGLTWDAEYEENKEIPGYYRVVNPYRTWAQMVNGTKWLDNGNYYVYVNCADPDRCYVEYSPLGITINPQHGMMFGMSFAYNELAGGATMQEVADLGYFGTLDSGELLFGSIEEDGQEWPTICVGVENNNNLYSPPSCYNFMIYFPELDKAPAHRVSNKKAASAFRPGFSVSAAAMATAPSSIENKFKVEKSISNAKANRLFRSAKKTVKP